LEKIGLSTHPNNYRTLNDYIEKNNLSLEKYQSKARRRCVTIKYSKENLIEKLNNGSCKLPSRFILKRLVEYGFKEYKCEECGISEWNGLPITLELHHKDGDRDNSEYDNLEILCPNCHSQSDTYRYKNKKPIKHISNRCVDCGQKIQKRSKRCHSCEAKHRAIGTNKPSKENLSDYIRRYSFCEIGRMYNVSDNAVRKWCISYGLPHKRRDIPT